MLSIIIMFCILLIYVIQPYDTLRCYTCHGKKQCDLSLLKNNHIKTIEGDDFYNSCSVLIDSNSTIIRDMIPSRDCRSSSNQFCCNEDLCNSIPLPPLPAFTSLSCASNDCQTNSNQCNNSNNDYVIYRSSATESCITIHRNKIYKSYKMGCSPQTTIIESSNNELISQELFCCNYPECNQRILPEGEAIRCYTCDSRITGLKNCMLLNTSSSHVYNVASSDPSESCAMIVGLAGKDLLTGRTYQTFTIRTFIQHCRNQSLGNVTYGGAIFQGRIECCSTSLCNTYPLYTNITVSITTPIHTSTISKIVVTLAIACLGLIFATIGITLSIYRFRQNRIKRRYIPSVPSDGTTVLFLQSSS